MSGFASTCSSVISCFCFVESVCTSLSMMVCLEIEDLVLVFELGLFSVVGFDTFVGCVVYCCCL